jgi:DNA invertase Pin-like site-specific DNA recombinase
MRAALYARVSTRDQQTLPMQLAEMREYAARRGWTVVLEVEDVASGAQARPRREELIKAAHRRQIDLIVVWRLDRWGRSLLDLIATLQDLLSLGVGFVSLSDALDMTTPGGRALAGMLAVFAEFERDILRERVKAGIAHARLQGKPHGRPPSAMTRAPEMQALFAQGLSKREIARRLNVSRTSVRRLVGPSDNEDTSSPRPSSGTADQADCKPAQGEPRESASD